MSWPSVIWIFEMNHDQLKSLKFLREKIRTLGGLDSKQSGEDQKFNLYWTDPDDEEDIWIHNDESLRVALKVSRKSSLLFKLKIHLVR